MTHYHRRNRKDQESDVSNNDNKKNNPSIFNDKAHQHLGILKSNNLDNLCPTEKELIFYPTGFGLTGYAFRTCQLQSYCSKTEKKKAKQSQIGYNPYGSLNNTIYTGDDDDFTPKVRSKGVSKITEKPNLAYF